MGVDQAGDGGGGRRFGQGLRSSNWGAIFIQTAGRRKVPAL
jgi:hypothetical protein